MEDLQVTAELDILKSKIIKVVQDGGDSSYVAVVDIIEPPELKGEHFATETVYAKVRFSNAAVKEKNFFVKKFPNNPVHAQMVKDMKVMEKEVTFYTEFLPCTRKFCNKFPGCEDLLNFFPKCLYGDDDCIIMENMVLDKGYIMLDKAQRQDFNTARLVFTNLAKFHAATFALIEELGRGEFRKKFPLCVKESFDFSETSTMAEGFDSGIGTCIKILTDHPIPGSLETIQKLGMLVGKVLPELEDLVVTSNSDDKRMLVLNHGDCWNNNMLFQMDKNGLISDHIFVDLQNTRYGSPCLDLGNFYFSSIKPDVRQAHCLDLLKIYYDQFQETAKALGTKCPITFEELLVNFKRYSKAGFLVTLTMFSAIGAFKEIDRNDMDTDMGKMIARFNKIVSDWIDNNPIEANQISKDMVQLVQEYEDLQRK